MTPEEKFKYARRMCYRARRPDVFVPRRYLRQAVKFCAEIAEDLPIPSDYPGLYATYPYIVCGAKGVLEQYIETLKHSLGKHQWFAWLRSQAGWVYVSDGSYTKLGRCEPRLAKGGVSVFEDGTVECDHENTLPSLPRLKMKGLAGSKTKGE